MNKKLFCSQDGIFYDTAAGWLTRAERRVDGPVAPHHLVAEGVQAVHGHDELGPAAGAARLEGHVERKVPHDPLPLVMAPPSDLRSLNQIGVRSGGLLRCCMCRFCSVVTHILLNYIQLVTYLTS